MESSLDNYFSLERSLSFVVPRQYRPERQKDDFKRYTRSYRPGFSGGKYSSFLSNESRFSDDMFKESVEDELIAGKRHHVEIFKFKSRIGETKRLDYCMSLLRQNSSMLVGWKGLSLLVETSLRELPTDMDIYSLDARWQMKYYMDGYEYLAIPYLRVREHGTYLLGADYRTYESGKKGLLCIR